ncbi:MAG: 1-acyl-sn-glycerol-3-phosphate acyltransferase, partial [Clostridia bacterium]|nr:1-acyl-sn-glycerol-3-phosphate acyltransferase [Clostridia bacterium]
MLFYIVISIIFLPCTILFPVIIKGKKNLKKLKKQNYIISCNHMSNLDPVMVDVRLKKKHYILAKKEL